MIAAHNVGAPTPAAAIVGLGRWADLVGGPGHLNQPNRFPGGVLELMRASGDQLGAIQQMKFLELAAPADGSEVSCPASSAARGPAAYRGRRSGLLVV